MGNDISLDSIPCCGQRASLSSIADTLTDYEKFKAGFSDTKMLVSLVGSKYRLATNSFEEVSLMTHPWASAPSTIGSASCHRLAILFASNKKSQCIPTAISNGVVRKLCSVANSFLNGSISKDHCHAVLIALGFLSVNLPNKQNDPTISLTSKSVTGNGTDEKSECTPPSGTQRTHKGFSELKEDVSNGIQDEPNNNWVTRRTQGMGEMISDFWKAQNKQTEKQESRIMITNIEFGKQLHRGGLMNVLKCFLHTSQSGLRATVLGLAACMYITDPKIAEEFSSLGGIEILVKQLADENHDIKLDTLYNIQDLVKPVHGVPSPGLLEELNRTGCRNSLLLLTSHQNKGINSEARRLMDMLHWDF